MNDFYKRAGVDIEAGDNLSAYAAECSRATWNSYYLDIYPNQGGNPDFFPKKKFVDLGCRLTAATDGVGTKVGVTKAAARRGLSEKSYFLTPEDACAMLWDDIARSGGRPVAMCSMVDVSTTKTPEYIRSLYEGMRDIAYKEDVAIIAGETAEMGKFVSGEWPQGFNYLLSGTAIGLTHPSLKITGEKVIPGDVVIALREPGFRSNGISGVRKILAQLYGEEWWHNPEATNHILDAVRPSIIYTPLLTHLNGWDHKMTAAKPRVPVKFIAHLSGGGVIKKFWRTLLSRCGYGTTLGNLFEPSDTMKKFAKISGMDDEELYTSWNGGQGALLVVEEKQLGRVLAITSEFGYAAQKCGVITKTPHLVLTSKFSGETLEIDP